MYTIPLKHNNGETIGFINRAVHFSCLVFSKTNIILSFTLHPESTQTAFQVGKICNTV